MTEEKRYTEAEAHRYFGVKLNNSTWEFLGKAERTAAEDTRMIHMAHASRFHWGEFPGATAANFARGDWLVSHVYAVLNQPGPAVKHARLSLQTCQDNALGDFDLAYAYEGMARALACAGDEQQASQYLQQAQSAGEQIAEAEDRSIFQADLVAEPWYGLSRA